MSSFKVKSDVQSSRDCGVRLIDGLYNISLKKAIIFDKFVKFIFIFKKYLYVNPTKTVIFI